MQCLHYTAVIHHLRYLGTVAHIETAIPIGGRVGSQLYRTRLIELATFRKRRLIAAESRKVPL